MAILLSLLFLIAWAAGQPDDGTGIGILALAGTFVVYFAYEVALVAVWGRTFGKWLFGVRVVRERDGGRPGWGRAVLRNLLPTVLLIVFFPLYPLPYIIAAVARDHRWPHDRLAGTVVLPASSLPTNG